METKQELRDKINELQNEISRLKAESIEKEKSFKNELQSSIQKIRQVYADKEYEEWKKKNAEYVRRIVASEISKIQFDEYHHGSDCSFERGLQVRYNGKVLGSVCTESY